VSGFRATASTLLNEMGRWNPDAIERQLAHMEENDDWMPITPKTGSLFHAETHPLSHRSGACAQAVARAASGHATVAPPIMFIKSRRARNSRSASTAATWPSCMSLCAAKCWHHRVPHLAAVVPSMQQPLDLRHDRSLTVRQVRLERHGSMRTPGLSRPCGSSAFFAARSASANSGGRCRSYHGR
jgi:hypothetical protein